MLWVRLGTSERVLEASRGHLGAFLGDLGAVLGCLGGLLWRVSVTATIVDIDASSKAVSYDALTCGVFACCGILSAAVTIVGFDARHIQ